MRKQVQINTGNGWNNLTSVFYEKGNAKDEKDAQKEAERQMGGWPRTYEPFRNAQFRIIDRA